MTTGKKKQMIGGSTLTDKTFKAVFQSLGQYYRLKEDERPDNNAMIEYYNAVKFVDDTDARKLYSEVVNSLRFFPKVPEIKEIAEKYRPKIGRFSNMDFCYCCLNVGHVTYIREENGYPYEYLVPEIKEIAEKYRPKIGRFSNMDFCYCCLNVGHVTYIREENGYPYEYLARCPYCDMGKNYPELPSVDAKFTPEEVKELIQKNRDKYGGLDHTKAEEAKIIIRTFLKSL